MPIGIHADACVPDLPELVNLVHAHGIHIGAELHHAGGGKRRVRCQAPHET